MTSGFSISLTYQLAMGKYIFVYLATTKKDNYLCPVSASAVRKHPLVCSDGLMVKQTNRQTKLTKHCR